MFIHELQIYVDTIFHNDNVILELDGPSHFLPDSTSDHKIC